jgi:hypothetical protein
MVRSDGRCSRTEGTPGVGRQARTPFAQALAAVLSVLDVLDGGLRSWRQALELGGAWASLARWWTVHQWLPHPSHCHQHNTDRAKTARNREMVCLLVGQPASPGSLG